MSRYRASWLKGVVLRLVRVRPVGYAAMQVCRALGMRHEARIIGIRIGHVPKWVPVMHGEPGGFVMSGEGGHEGVARAVWRHGWSSYEAPMPDLIRDFGRRQGDLIDIGSHSGYYGLLWLSVARGGRVLGFEPYPPILRVLRKNIEKNGVGDRFEVLDCALSDASGEAVLHVPTTKTDLVEMACTLNESLYGKELGSIRVRKETLDGVLAGRSDRRVGVIKMDVETHEPEVLRGARGTLKAQRPIVIMEVLPRADLAALNSAFEGLDYGFYQVRGGAMRKTERIESDPEHHNQIAVPGDREGEAMEVFVARGLEIEHAA